MERRQPISADLAHVTQQSLKALEALDALEAGPSVHVPRTGVFCWCDRTAKKGDPT
jgi:hypothetical protein